MTPAEHYREAERLLAKAQQGRQPWVTYPSAETYEPTLLAAAQVHATLAMAAEPATS